MELYGIRSNPIGVDNRTSLEETVTVYGFDMEGNSPYQGHRHHIWTIVHPIFFPYLDHICPISPALVRDQFPNLFIVGSFPYQRHVDDELYNLMFYFPMNAAHCFSLQIRPPSVVTYFDGSVSFFIYIKNFGPRLSFAIQPCFASEVINIRWLGKAL